MRKICFVTGSRADYGIMSRLMLSLRDDDRCELQIVAANMHLSERYGLTYKEIESDGLKIDAKVQMEAADDSAAATVKSMGVAMAGFADAFSNLAPDLIVILGDRYEMLAAASAAQIFGIPVAHLHGGEITEGAYDDAIRHAITKLSYMHFTSTEEYRRRVIQMGEAPERVFNVGALAVENIAGEIIMPLDELERSLGFVFGEGFLLVTFHPVTKQPVEGAAHAAALLDALAKFIPEHKILFTLPNSDTGGRLVADMIKVRAKDNPESCIAVTSLGRHRYYSALAHCGAVVGNSSSGLIEAPSFGKPTVNIGDRQKGRAQGNTIINCAPETEAVKDAVAKALSPEFQDYCAREGVNPYAGMDTLRRIHETLVNTPLAEHAVKSFRDLQLG